MSAPILTIIYPKDVAERCTRGDVTGAYGRMEAKDFKCGFMFRLDGYVRLPPGLYRAEFSRMGEQRNGARCIRYTDPLNNFKLTEAQKRVLTRDSILIHAAQHPGQLKGCQAPGEHRAPDGWVEGSSTTTLAALFNALGGHQMNKTLVIEVKDE